MVLGLTYRLARRCARTESDDAQEVWMAHGPPRHAARYQEVFRCPGRFGQAKNALVFARSYLDERQPLADPQMRELLKQDAERMLSDLEPSNLPDQVRALLRREADLSNLSATRVARMLGLELRAFRRQLLQTKTSWRALMDEARYRIARDELNRTGCRSG